MGSEAFEDPVTADSLAVASVRRLLVIERRADTECHEAEYRGTPLTPVLPGGSMPSMSTLQGRPEPHCAAGASGKSQG